MNKFVVVLKLAGNQYAQELKHLDLYSLACVGNQLYFSADVFGRVIKRACHALIR